MKRPYLEITFRHGRPVAAYYYLPRRPDDRSIKTVKASPGILVDYTRGDRPIGIEITTPGRVSLEAVNRVLADLGLDLLHTEDFAPLLAA